MTALRWPVRVWILAEIMFGALGASSVLVSPDRTAENFAWPIASPVGAGVIGAGYGSVAVMLMVALFARHWEQVRAVVIAAAVLTALMLVTTVLHWDEFSVGSPAFELWLVSYVVPPPTLAALYWWQQRRAEPLGHGVQEPLPRWWRRWLGFNGLALAVIWSVLFLVPQVALDLAPWPTSPLLVRVYAGWLLGYAVLLTVAALDKDWRRSTSAVVWLVALPTLLAVQLSRFAGEVDWRNLALLLLLADLALLGLTAGMAWLDRRVPVEVLARVAVAGVAVFLLVIALIPVLRPDLDVRSRWVGEYGQGSFGWLMTTAYVALGLGALALAAALREAVGVGRRAHIARRLLVVAGVGAFAAALLPQNPTDATPGTSAGALRDLLLVPTFASLLGALVLIAVALWRRPEWHFVGVGVAWATGLVVVALVVSFSVPESWRGLAGRYFDATWAMLLLAVANKIAFRRGAGPASGVRQDLPDRVDSDTTTR